MTRRLVVVPAHPATALERAKEDYLANVRAKGGSPRTESKYSDVLGRIFLPWAAEHNVTDPGQLTQRDLDRFAGDLLSEPSPTTGRVRSKASVASYLRDVRAFLKWCQREELAGEKLHVQPVKVPRKTFPTLTRQEMADMEAAASTERDKLIIRVLSDCGLRLEELLSLKPTALVEDGRLRYLQVVGKGSRERLVPIKPAVYQRLKRYIAKDRPQDAWTERIFVSLRRRGSGGYEALDPRAVQQMLIGVGAKAGMKKPVNPHAFRHSMITNALRDGGNPVLIAKVVGHKDLSQITSTYEHLLAGDAHREMMRLLADE
jgi:integrase